MVYPSLKGITVDLTTLDLVLGAFVSALTQAQFALAKFSIPLLASLGIVYYTITMWHVVLTPGADGFAAALMAAITLGLWYFVASVFGALALAVLNSFLTFGSAAGGLSEGSLTSPSGVFAVGFDVAKPLIAFTQTFSGWSLLSNIFQLSAIWLCALTIVILFGVMSLFMLVAIVEAYLAIAAGTVLIPFGVLSQTSNIAEFGGAWVVGSSVRLFLIALLLSTANPLFRAVVPQLTPAGNISLESCLVMAIVTGGYTALVYVGYKRASTIAARGMALGLGQYGLGTTGAVRTAASAVASTAGPAVGAAAAGVSRMLRRG